MSTTCMRPGEFHAPKRVASPAGPRTADVRKIELLLRTHTTSAYAPMITSQGVVAATSGNAISIHVVRGIACDKPANNQTD
jgi:hypothetical protein